MNSSVIVVLSVTLSLVAMATGHPPPCSDTELVPECKPCETSCATRSAVCPKNCEKTTECFCKPGLVWKDGQENCVPPDSCPSTRKKRDDHDGGHDGGHDGH